MLYGDLPNFLKTAPKSQVGIFDAIKDAKLGKEMIFPSIPKLSESTYSILREMLVKYPENRINWEQLFQKFNQKEKPKIEENKIEIEFSPAEFFKRIDHEKSKNAIFYKYLDLFNEMEIKHKLPGDFLVAKLLILKILIFRLKNLRTFLGGGAETICLADMIFPLSQLNEIKNIGKIDEITILFKSSSEEENNLLKEYMLCLYSIQEKVKRNEIHLEPELDEILKKKYGPVNVVYYATILRRILTYLKLEYYQQNLQTVDINYLTYIILILATLDKSMPWNPNNLIDSKGALVSIKQASLCMESMRNRIESAFLTIGI